MTYAESLELNFNRKFRNASKCTIAVLPNSIVPQDPVTLAHDKIAEPSKSFNGMSINDLRLLDKFRYSDSLHRPDLLKPEYERAQKLSSFKKFGAGEFVSHYFNH